MKIESGDHDKCLSVADGRVDAITNEAGVFELEQLHLGVYELEAQKPEDGYCATFQDPMKIVLPLASPNAEVIFHLPPKCARLKGTVSNAKTGELLTDVSLRLRPTKGPDHCEVATFGEQIPSQREFTLEVLAKGFETWAYSNTSDPNSAGKGPATPLTLQPGEQLDLNVRLTPLPDTRTWAGIDCPIRDRDHAEEEQ
jgi:hypothetical protein